MLTFAANEANQACCVAFNALPVNRVAIWLTMALAFFVKAGPTALAVVVRLVRNVLKVATVTALAYSTRNGWNIEFKSVTWVAIVAVTWEVTPFNAAAKMLDDEDSTDFSVAINVANSDVI